MKVALYFSIVLLALTGLVSSADDKVIVCYVGTWATYRPGLGQFNIEDIDPNLCTHLVYAFAGLADDSSIVSLDPWLDVNSTEGGGRDNFRLFNSLKTQNPNLKTLLAVGGYNEGSAKYSVMVADPVLRGRFISTALQMVLTFGFDGIDMDWEYPNQRDSVNGEADIENFTTFLRELKEEFSQYGLLVTVAVAAVRQSASLSYDVVGVSSNVDYVHLMTYDLHGPWEAVTGHNAGLYRSASELSIPEGSELTVDAAVQYWLGAGCPPEKLVLGLPFYGHTFTLTSADSNDVGAPASGVGLGGPFTVSPGLANYNEICNLLTTEAWDIRFDELARVPYAVQNLNWVSYDDPASIAEKVDYALKYNLAGALIWSLEGDDFNGICQNETFPLLRSINRALGKLEEPTTAPSTSAVTTNPTETTSTTTPSTSTSTTTPRSTSTSTTTSQSTTTPPTTTASTSTVSTTTTTSESVLCEAEGQIPNPEDCGSFFYCVRDLTEGFNAILFECPSSLYWDQKILACNYPNLVSCKN